MRKEILWHAALVSFVLVAFVVTATPAQQKPVNIAGKWEMTWEGARRKSVTKLTFEQDGEKLKGTIARPEGEVALSGTVKGNSVAFTVERETPQGKVTSEYKGTIEGDTMKGIITSGGRTIPWTAKRWTI